MFVSTVTESYHQFFESILCTTDQSQKLSDVTVTKLKVPLGSGPTVGGQNDRSSRSEAFKCTLDTSDDY